MITYFGCSGWYYREWKDLFYPNGLHQKDYFSYYANHFNSVELNSTFYHFPAQESVQAWYKQAPKNFKYSIKANREITHIKRFKAVRPSLDRLYGLSDILAEKTGCFLFQFPRSFSFNNERFVRILSQINLVYKNVIEFRHPSWWQTHVTDTFTKSKVILCSVMEFHLPQVLMSTNKCAYMRFHGELIYSGSYTKEELSKWKEIVKSSSVQECWAYFNNTMHGHAVQNTFEFASLFQNDSLTRKDAI